MLSLKEEYTLSFLNLPVIGLCSSSVNCWFDILSLLIAPPEVFTPAEFHAFY